MSLLVLFARVLAFFLRVLAFFLHLLVFVFGRLVFFVGLLVFFTRTFALFHQQLPRFFVLAGAFFAGASPFFFARPGTCAAGGRVRFSFRCRGAWLFDGGRTACALDGRQPARGHRPDRGPAVRAAGGPGYAENLVAGLRGGDAGRANGAHGCQER